jgi:hypothetical protein
MHFLRHSALLGIGLARAGVRGETGRSRSRDRAAKR